MFCWSEKMCFCCWGWYVEYSLQLWGNKQFDFLHGFHQCGIRETPAGDGFKGHQPWPPLKCTGNMQNCAEGKGKHIYAHIYIVYVFLKIFPALNPCRLRVVHADIWGWGRGLDGAQILPHPKAQSRAKQCHPVGRSSAGHLYLCLLQICLNFNCESFDAFFMCPLTSWLYPLVYVYAHVFFR